MAVNWALGLQQGNPGESFANAFHQGQETNRLNMARQAMGALVQNPNDPQALAALAKIDPQAAMQFQQQHAEQAKAQLAQHRESILNGAQIIREVNPHDEPSWQQARQLYAQQGGDLRDVPEHWDDTTAQYASGLTHLANTFKPEPNGQIVPYAPGGGVARMNPQTHQLETLVMPNDGAHQTGTPASGNVPHVTDQSSYDAVPPGSQYMAPDGHLRVKQGGQPVAPAGNF